MDTRNGWAICPTCDRRTARVRNLPLPSAHELIGLIDYSIGGKAAAVDLANGAKRAVVITVTNGTRHDAEAVKCPRGHTVSSVLTN